MAMSRQTAERLARIHAHNQLDREAIARGKREQEERAEKKLLAPGGRPIDIVRGGKVVEDMLA